MPKEGISLAFSFINKFGYAARQQQQQNHEMKAIAAPIDFVILTFACQTFPSMLDITDTD